MDFRFFVLGSFGVMCCMWWVEWEIDDGVVSVFENCYVGFWKLIWGLIINDKWGLVFDFCGVWWVGRFMFLLVGRI